MTSILLATAAIDVHAAVLPLWGSLDPTVRAHLLSSASSRLSLHLPLICAPSKPWHVSRSCQQHLPDCLRKLQRADSTMGSSVLLPCVGDSQLSDTNSEQGYGTVLQHKIVINEQRSTPEQVRPI